MKDKDDEVVVSLSEVWRKGYDTGLTEGRMKDKGGNEIDFNVTTDGKDHPDGFSVGEKLASMKMKFRHDDEEQKLIDDLVFGLPRLTKREYFAGLAMQGFLSKNDFTLSEVPCFAVKCADDLIAELEK